MSDVDLNIEITPEHLAELGGGKIIAKINEAYGSGNAETANVRALGAMEGWAIGALASKNPAVMEAALTKILAAARASNGRRVIDGTYW